MTTTEGYGLHFHIHSFSSPSLVFAVPSSVSSMLSHVFCYVNVITQEHPRIDKHATTWARSPLIIFRCWEFLLPSHIVLLFTVSDVSDSAFFHSFSFAALRGLSPLYLCRSVCTQVLLMSIGLKFFLPLTRVAQRCDVSHLTGP